MDNCIDPRDDRADWDDLLVDTTLRRYRCSEKARRLDTQQKIVGFQPPHAPLNDQGALSAPLRETQRAIDESRAKRLSGELPTFAASVQCSNPRMIQAFNAAHYRYMDLIETLDGLARYRHVVGVHDAMNEADEQPPCYQRCLARDHQVGECAVPVSGVNRLWVMPRDDVISETPDRIQIPVRREELEGADTDVARRDAGQYRAGNGVSRQTAIGKKPHTRADVPIPKRSMSPRVTFRIVKSLKVLDPHRPIREADIACAFMGPSRWEARRWRASRNAVSVRRIQPARLLLRDYGAKLTP